MVRSKDKKAMVDQDTVGSELDKEINAIQIEVSRLKAQRLLQASTILSFQSTQSTLIRLREEERKRSTVEDLNTLLSTAKTQYTSNQTNLHRLCATITSFTIQDPDPNAVDDGKILALRYDISNNGKFIRPYYVMLNRPWEGQMKKMLCVHRHTLPPAIPLVTLVKKYLPSGAVISATGGKNEREVPKQSIIQFSRALRRSIVAYHNRISLLKSIRRDFFLDSDESTNNTWEKNPLLDLSATDAEIKNIRIEWADGRNGRLVLDEDGKIKKFVVINADGRVRETGKALLGDMMNFSENLRENYFNMMPSPSLDRFA